MGMLQLKRLMSGQKQEQRRPRKVRSRCKLPPPPLRDSVPYGSIAMSKPRKDNSQRRKRTRFSGPDLPLDIWCQIHSLIPMRDSARVACVSRTFQDAWLRHPNLILNKETLGFTFANGDITRSFTGIVHQILKKHSRNGVMTLELDISDCHDLNPRYLNYWLQIGITPGTENVTLMLPPEFKEGYNFPWSLLFDGNGSSIRQLHLTHCTFYSTGGIGCLRSLTKLHLYDICVAEDEFGCLLSSSLGLMQLELAFCKEIICLKIPCMLEQFSCLTVSRCSMLQIIESKAPNLSTINFEGNLVQLSLGQQSNVMSLDMQCSDESNFLCYAITKLPYIVPNLKTLSLSSDSEMVTTPMVASKFVHLKHLQICLGGGHSEEYDFLSLISFLDAAPVLEAFVLGVYQSKMNFDSVFGNTTHMRQMPEHKHHSLKDLMIFGFCSARSMVELTCHILESATNLESVTLDCVFDENDEENTGRCSVTSDRKPGDCFPLNDEMILEANKGIMAIDTYIASKVPSAVKLDVRGPCSRCHSMFQSCNKQ